MKRKYEKLELPREVFRYGTVDEQISGEQVTRTPVTKLEWNGGIFLYLEGAEYPQKGMASPEAMWAINLAKKIFIESLRVVSKWYVLPTFAIFALVPFRNKVKMLDTILTAYCRMTFKSISPVILKSEYLTPVAQELEWVVYSFLSNLGVSPPVCSQFSEIFATIVEYDNAYRLRIEDVFSETTKAPLVDNSRKELVRLLKIVGERDSEYVAKKFQLVGKLLWLALLHPKFKKAFKIAVSEIDVRKMSLDEADKYWVCLREDYKFMGLSNEERKALIKDRKKPVLITRKW